LFHFFIPNKRIIKFYVKHFCYAETGDDVATTNFKLLLRHSPEVTAMESETPTYFQKAYKLKDELHIRLRNGYSLSNHTKKNV
jgi:hypothetical protein